jgi:hemolysin activation/secretion protein
MSKFFARYAQRARPGFRRVVLVSGVGVTLSLASGGRALAQLVDPGVLNPGLQQQQQLEQQQQQRLPNVERGKPKPLIEQQPEVTPTDQADPELLINKVQIQGARVIPVAQLEAPFAPLLGQTIRFSRLQQALNDASNVYRDAGYFTSRVVVAQGALKDGVLTVQAVEGFLEDVEITGRGGEGLRRWVRFYLQPLLSSAAQPSPVRFAQLERQILLMQSFGGVRFNSSLAQGRSFAGSVLVIDLNPKTLSGSISLNNNIQLQLGDYQLAAQLQANVLEAPQPLQVDLYGSNAFPYPGGMASGNLVLSTPLGNRGLRLVGTGSLTSTSSIGIPINVGGNPIALSTGGESWLGNVALRYPVVLSRTGSLGVSLAAELQNASSNTYLDNVVAIANPSRLRVLRLGVDGSLSTPFYASSANLQLSQGLPIADAIDSVTLAQTNGSLPYGSVSYTSARLTLRHQQRLGRSDAFMTLTGSGQLASSVLPGAEDFSYGGPFLGRAYRSSYLIGDQGAAGALELSYGFYRGPWALTPFVYGDVGVASNKGGLLTPSNYNAASYGLGLRGGWGSNASFEFGWGIPAGSFPATAGQVGPANSIVYFRTSVLF